MAEITTTTINIRIITIAITKKQNLLKDGKSILAEESQFENVEIWRCENSAIWKFENLMIDDLAIDDWRFKIRIRKSAIGNRKF